MQVGVAFTVFASSDGVCRGNVQLILLNEAFKGQICPHNILGNKSGY